MKDFEQKFLSEIVDLRKMVEILKCDRSIGQIAYGEYPSKAGKEGK